MKAKKHLGQNFLNSQKFIGDVIRASNLTKTDTVLEIGPGKGALTEPLLEVAGHVIAIEKDPELIVVLNKKFETAILEKRFTLVEGDALSVDIEDYTDKPYVLVANIPYYITGLILRHFLSSKVQPKQMTLVVQREIATRIVSRDRKESILSLSVGAYGTPSIIGKIPARYFSPKPKVDSAILHIENISRDFFDKISEEEFFEFVKAGFGHKRKKLINNLESLYPKSVLAHAFACCDVSENTRAEELPLVLWKKLLSNVRD